MKLYDVFNVQYYAWRVTKKSKEHIMKYLKFSRKKSLKIVDLGCAEEWYCVRDTIEEGIDVYGNASTCVLENALDKVKDRNPFGSLTEIPFSDGEEFDIVTVTVFDVIEHIHSKGTSYMVKETSRVLKPDGIIVISTPTTNFGGCVFDLTHINVRPPSFWKLKFEERNLRMKSLYISPFNKYCMKNYFPIPDSIELLLEELFRYNNILGCYYVRKKARLCFVVNKPRHISGD